MNSLLSKYCNKNLNLMMIYKWKINMTHYVNQDSELNNIMMQYKYIILMKILM